MKSSSTGVIIGRFQPLHLGHVWLIEKTLDKFPQLIIYIGSSNIKDKDNPWDYKTRKKMLTAFTNLLQVKESVIKIDKIEDVPNDDDWLKIALKKIGDQDFTVIGDNEWVNRIFEKAGYKVLRMGYFNREEYEGVKIRKLMRENENWESKVPKYIVELIKS